MPVQIQLRHGTAAQWTAADPTLAEGEAGTETDTGKFKVGDGTTIWSVLAYSSGTTGATGAAGATGATGPGVPVGGAAGEVLAKIDGTNYNTEWIAPGGVADILDLPTAEMDDALVLAPDGAGGVAFRAETGGVALLPDPGAIWETTHVYALGERVKDTATVVGESGVAVFEVVVAGTSAGTIPAWGVGGYYADGTAAWLYIGQIGGLDCRLSAPPVAFAHDGDAIAGPIARTDGDGTAKASPYARAFGAGNAYTNSLARVDGAGIANARIHAEYSTTKDAYVEVEATSAAATLAIHDGTHVGDAGQVLTSDGTHAAWAAAAGGSVSTVTQAIGADYTTPSDSTWTDITGLTGISLAAGTWMGWVDIEASCNASFGPVYRVYDGTNTLAQMGDLVSNPVATVSHHLVMTMPPTVLASGATVSIQVYSDTAFTVKRYPTRGGVSLTTTQATFLKVA